MRPPVWQMEEWNLKELIKKIPMNNKGIPMVRRQTTAWEKVFASYSFVRRFMSSIYKNNKKPTNQPNDKCSASFSIWKIQIKVN